jgi:hypothetical protein
MCSLLSLPLELNFWYPSLNLSCGYFPGKSSTPKVLEVSCILPKMLSFYLCCSPILVYLEDEKTWWCSTFLISFFTFAPLCKPDRPGFIPDRVTRESLGGDQFPLLSPKGRPIEQVPEPSLGSSVQQRFALWCAGKGKSLHLINRSTGT